MTESVEIFCAYAHEDEPLRNALAKHLSALKRQGLITNWHDREINAGKEWAKEIDRHLNNAQIILLLISSDFLDSDYCYGVELKRAMERHKGGEACVIPIILRPVDWEHEPLGQLNVLPFDGRPVTNWPNPDEAFREIAKGIRKIVEEIRAMSASSLELKDSADTSGGDVPPITIDATSTRQRKKHNFRLARTTSHVQTPSLILLLGTTSAITGLELMRQMLPLEEPGDRQRVALVYIDTDDPPAELVQFRQDHQRSFQEFSLRIAVPTDIHEAEIAIQTEEEQTETAVGQEQHVFIEGRIPQSIARGTGGIRNNGHIAVWFHYHSICETLERALNAILHPNADRDEEPFVHREVQVNIVAFLGGGTGSGILADIAVLVGNYLMQYQLKQRLNLFCILPEPVRGVSVADLNWRKSNATACLLELLAYSTAATATPSRIYRKYVWWNRACSLTNDPIANEIYLVGKTSLGDAGYTARLVGSDLFQRITDASGVGFLEHSKWVDRRTLGETDDRGLPTMFGTTCPLEIRFPAEEVVTSFAQISAAHLLLELEHYQPSPLKTTVIEEQGWLTKWNDMLDFQLATSKSVPITLPTFRREEFVRAHQAQLNDQWYKLETFEREIERQIKVAFLLKRQEEEQRINVAPHLDAENIEHLRFIYQHIQSLQKLQEEYTCVLEALKERPIPQVPPRPVELEERLLHLSFKKFFRDYAALLCESYNERIRYQARATYYRLLIDFLQDLSRQVEEALSTVWFKDIDIKAYAKKLSKTSLTSQVWRGYLEHPHPNQRHLFGLRRMMSSPNGRNVAMERLYRWATGGEQWVGDDEASGDTSNELFLLGEASSSRQSSKSALVPVKSDVVSVQRQQADDMDTWEPRFNYGIFVDRFVEHLRAVASGTSAHDDAYRKRQNAMKMLELVADQAVTYFQAYYREIFRDMNLFELLDKTTPPSQSEQERTKQISNHLLEHLQHMRGLMSDAIAFEPELWHQGLSTLDTSLYLGIQWRSNTEREILETALDNLGPLTERGQSPIRNSAIDPHRLQLSYGQHAISLSTIRDFYLEHNSAMEAYLLYQQQWETTNGTGSQPVHSSGEAQRLVWEKDALGYDMPLPQRVIRHP